MNAILRILFLFLLPVACLQAQIPSYVPTNGLIGWWGLNGNTNDESGNGNHGSILGGAILSVDRYNNINSCYEIDGVNCPDPKGIILPAATSNKSNYTISVWYKSSVKSKQYQCIINSSPHNFIGANFNYLSSNTIAFFAGNGIWWPSLTDTLIVDNLENWNHLTIVKNGLNFYYFNNALLLKTIPFTNNFNTGDITSFVTGAISINGGSNCYETFSGKLDDIGIWNRALDSNEIVNLFQGISSQCSYSIKESDTIICKETTIELNAIQTSSIKSDIPKDGLVGYWPFNGNSNDETGNGNNGIVDRASLTTDRCGKSNNAFLFDGISSKITIKDSPLLRPTSFTCSAWIYLEDDNHLNQILAKNAGEGPFESVDMCIHNGNGYNYLANIGGPDYYGTWLMSSDKVQLNKWQLMTFIFDDFKDSVYSYIDDKLVLQSYEAKSITYDTLPWSFGSERENGAWSWFFKGKIDDVTIWNRPLAYNEIAQVYNSSSCNCAEALTDDKYVWSTGQRGRIIMVKPDTTTSYILTVLDGSSIHRDSIKVTVHPNSSTTILGSRFVCLSSTLEKYFVSKQNGESYFWYPPKLGVYTTNQVEDSVVIHWTTTGIDTLRVSINNTLTGCTRDTFIIVSVINAIEPKIATFGNQKTLCKGDSRGLECLTDAQSYQWKRNGKIIDGANDKIYLAFEAGEYTVHIKSGICEGESEILKLIEYDNPKPLILGEKNVVAGSDELEYRVSAQGVKSTLWSVSNNAIIKGSPLSDKINIQFPEPGKVKVSAKQESEFGCTGEDSIIILVTSMTDVKEARSSSFEFFISPNPTGESDQFLVRFAEKQHQDISIELLDILGSVHYTNTLQAGSESCTIPVQGLSFGIYMLRVRKNNEVLVEKVIVN